MPLGTPQSTPLILSPPLPLLTRPSPPLPPPPESTARQRGISGYSTQTGVAPSWAQMHYRDLQLHRGDNPAPPSHPLTLSERLPCYLLSVAQILPIFSSANSRLKTVLSEIDTEIKERAACQIEKKSLFAPFSISVTVHRLQLLIAQLLLMIEKYSSSQPQLLHRFLHMFNDLWENARKWNLS